MELTTGGVSNLYYFQRNLQGDVVAIYDTNGTLKAKYLYDAWGNCTISSETTDYTVANANPIRYRGYYYDDDTGLYYCNARYYSPKWRRFISPDDTAYLDPKNVNGLNLYCYCYNDPINYCDPSGCMPEWAKWLVGGLAIAGLVAATILTFGAAGTVAGTIGAAMLAGGVISGGINALDQLRDGGTFNWTELAIATLSGTAYGAVVGATGGAWTWGAFGGKVLIAGATSALNTWNDDTKTGKDIAKSAANGMALSVAIQFGVKIGMPYVGKFVSSIISKIFPKDPNYWLTIGDIALVVWNIPAVKAGATKFGAGIVSSIFDDIL